MRPASFILVTGLCTAILASAPAAAQDRDLTVLMMDLARSTITGTALPGGTPVPPETEQELLTAIIPVADGHRIVDAGIRSGYAAWCNTEWDESSFTALMDHERDSEIWSDKQIAYIGLLHGITMGFYQGSLSEAGTCPPAQAASIRALIDAHTFE